jgi:hypothetical protein
MAIFLLRLRHHSKFTDLGTCNDFDRTGLFFYSLVMDHLCTRLDNFFVEGVAELSGNAQWTMQARTLAGSGRMPDACLVSSGTRLHSGDRAK